MRRRRSLGIPLAAAVLLLAMPAAPCFAQEVTVRAQAQPMRVEEGDQVTLAIEIAGESLDQVPPPDLSQIDDFQILGGPSSSTRFQWINGRTSSSKTYTYLLRPRHAGGLTIPSLGVLVHGQTLRTRPIEIEVLRAGGLRSPAAPPPAGSMQGGGPGVGPGVGGPGLPRPGARQPGGAGVPEVRVRSEVEDHTVYVGQQLTLRVFLDTQTQILNLGLQDPPTFPGFWAEEIKVPESLEVKRVQIGNAPFNEYTLMKRALFPTSTGSLTIPPMSYQIQVRRLSQDPIESFFFTPTETVVRRTEPAAVNVLPLPAAGKPSGFSGAVGSFNIAVTADRASSQVNDAIGVKVRISGEGSLNALGASPLPELSDFKQYAPKVASTVAIQNDRLRSEKIWDYVLIPLAPGAQTVPPITLSFFDPRKKEYREISSPAIPIQVARGAERAGAPAPAMNQSDVRQVRQDIHYIKLAPRGLVDRSRPFYRSTLFALLVLMPFAADLGLLVYARATRDPTHAGRRLRRERRARGRARRRLKEARRRLAPATSRAFYAAVAQALTEYVADKFDTAAAGLTHQRIEELLAGAGAPDALRADYHRALEACDYARFAPTSSIGEEMQRTLQAAERILVALERSLPG